jgi:predicted Zn-dependent protease
MRVLEKVLSFADAEAVVAGLRGGAESSTRFADNAITQHVERNNVSLGVLCAYGQSHGMATTNDLAEASLRAAVERAQAIARVSPPDPEYMPPVEASEADRYPEIEAYYEATAEIGPVEKAKSVQKAIEKVKARDLRLSGAFATDRSFVALANSAGLRGYHRLTEANVHATVLTDTGSGWAEKIANTVEDIHLEEVAEKALEIAEASRDPAESEAGKYTVILHPAAVAELIAFLFWGGFDAKATDEGRTCLREKLDTKICGEAITIRSDPANPQCPGVPFQHNGLTSPALNWIERGILRNLFYSRYWAKLKGKEPTGYPSNIIMDGGDTTVEAMIASTEKGLLVTRFWYIRFVDPMVPLVTGMTRDGLFRIEGGRVTGPIKHMRFNENPLEVLNRVESLGRPERTGEYIGMLMPALKVRDFNFTSTTKF